MVLADAWAPQHWPVVELAIESASKVHVSGERVDPVEVNSLRDPLDCNQ
jgi:hypothetical protein